MGPNQIKGPPTPLEPYPGQQQDPSLTIPRSSMRVLHSQIGEVTRGSLWLLRPDQQEGVGEGMIQAGHQLI